MIILSGMYRDEKHPTADVDPIIRTVCALTCGGIREEVPGEGVLVVVSVVGHAVVVSLVRS